MSAGFAIRVLRREGFDLARKGTSFTEMVPAPQARMPRGFGAVRCASCGATDATGASEVASIR